MRNIYDQILTTILSQEKPAFLDGKETVVPAYNGLSIANLPGSISRWLGCSLKDSPPFAPIVMNQFDKKFEHVILLLMDGLNLSIFNHFFDDVIKGKQQKEWKPLLSKGIFAPLTSIVPSTTSAALTTLWTGKLPIEHGIIGYDLFLKEFGCITNMITHSVTSFINHRANMVGAGFDPSNFLPVTTLGTHFRNNGVKAHTFQHYTIAGSGLSQMIFRDVESHAFRTESDLWNSVREVFEDKVNTKTFTYIYWSEIDTRSHRSGPLHPSIREEWNTFAHFLFQFLSAAVSLNHRKTLFLLTADHGQIPTDILTEYDLNTHADLLDHLIMKPTGESRLPFLFVKKDHEEKVAQYLSTHWNQQFGIVSSTEFLNSGLMGFGKAYKGTTDRIGNWVVIPSNNAYWWWVNKDNVLRGRHGGLSPQEMLVPFFAIEL
jgi:predicted AlkP superfamily pyrophosphatase or phosphodiesterase